MLAGVLSSDPAAGARLAEEALAQAGSGTDRALLPVLAALAAQLPDADARLGRLLLLLVDLEDTTLAEVAPLLGVGPDDGQALLDAARHRAAIAARGTSCRGWGLVAGRDRLTAPERQAAGGHLQLCRRCRERLTALDRARREVMTAAAGVAVLTTGAAAAAHGTAAVAGGVLAGKAASLLVAGLAASVAVGGGIAAVAQSSTATAPRPPAVPAPAAPAPVAEPLPSAAPAAPAECTSACTTASPVAVPPPPTTASAPGPSTSATPPPDEVVPALPALPLATPPALPLPHVLPLPLATVPPLPSLLPLAPALR